MIALERALGISAKADRHPNLSGWWLDVQGTPEDPELVPLESVELMALDAENGHRPRLAFRPVMKVEVVRSRRRHKTVQARQIGDLVRVSVPGHHEPGRGGALG